MLPELNTKGLSARDFQTAIDVQSACNPVALVNHFQRIMQKVSHEAKMKGKGTEYIMNHPICRLFAEQVKYLMCTTDYMKAYQECEEHAPRG